MAQVPDEDFCKWNVPKLIFPWGEGGGLGVSALEDEAGGGCGGSMAEWGRACGRGRAGCPGEGVSRGWPTSGKGGAVGIKVGSSESAHKDLPPPPP